MLRALFHLAFGVHCPWCGDAEDGAALRSSTLGDRFYRCPSCGARRTAAPILGPWRDASGPEFAAPFAPPSPVDPWTLPIDLEASDPVLSPNHADLVRNKRLRNPGEPNGPGLLP